MLDSLYPLYFIAYNYMLFVSPDHKRSPGSFNELMRPVT